MNINEGATAGAPDTAGTATQGSAQAGLNVSQGTQTTNSATAGSVDWTTGLNDELRGYVQNKGFKDPASVVDSYRNLEKLHGVPRERLLKLPEKAEDPAWNDIYNRLGRPDKAEEYGLAAPEGSDGNFAKMAAGKFHELGLSKTQAQKLSEWWNGSVGDQAKQMQQERVNQLQQEQTALKKEWGAAYDQNVDLAKRAAGKFGLSKELIAKMEAHTGFSDIMKFMANVGTALGEHNYVSGDSKNPGFGAMTPDAAMNEMNMLRNDSAWIQKFMNNDVEAKKRWDQLNKYAFPDLS
jgi:hypothetical protein